jgi:hypothetical protein
MAIDLWKSPADLRERRKKLVDLGWFLPCGRVQRIWEREAGSGPEMAIVLWKSPADLGERSR